MSAAFPALLVFKADRDLLPMRRRRKAERRRKGETRRIASSEKTEGVENRPVSQTNEEVIVHNTKNTLQISKGYKRDYPGYMSAICNTINSE